MTPERVSLRLFDADLEHSRIFEVVEGDIREAQMHALVITGVVRHSKLPDSEEREKPQATRGPYYPCIPGMSGGFLLRLEPAENFQSDGEAWPLPFPFFRLIFFLSPESVFQLRHGGAPKGVRIIPRYL